MSARRISQREARLLRKRVEQMESQERTRHARFCHDYPGGVHVESLDIPAVSFAKLDISQRLGFSLVAKCKGPNAILIYAVKP